MRIHHATTKKAVRAGIELVEVDGLINANYQGRTLARSEDPKDALETALRELNGGAAPKRTRKPSKAKARKSVDADEGDEDGEFDGEEAGDEEGDESDADQGKSVVKSKYRKKYQPHKATCGDSLTKQIAREFHTKVDPDSKKPVFNWARFVRFAKANDVWVPAYNSLKNHGLARMSVANRLRAKIRKKVEIDWNVE